MTDIPVLQTISDALVAIMQHYPENAFEAQKAMASLRMHGEKATVVKKRLDVLLGNLPPARDDSERELLREIAHVFYADEITARSKRLVVRTTQEELLDLHDQAEDANMSLSDWVRQKIGLDVF